jgi:glycosyltransferase involved in cell wall biosynthesis
MNESRLKIAFAHMFTLRTPRGIERYVINAANALARRGHEITLITGRSALSPTRGWIDSRVRVREIFHHNWHKLSFVPSFMHEFIAGDYDIVNVGIARGEGYAAGIAYKLKKFRFNIIFHYPYENHEKHYNAFKRFGAASSAGELIGVSRYVATGVEKCFGRSAGIVPNGVDQDHFRPDLQRRAQIRCQLNIPETAPVLLTVSALQGRKGIGKALEAVSVLRRTVPDVKYIVIGDGNEKDRDVFFTTVKKLGLESCVIVPGSQSDVAPFYNAADIFVFLPEFEAFGIVAIEAMASRLPIVVSRGSAFPEILANGGGVMVDPDSTQEVSNTIAALLADHGRRVRLGDEGRKSIQERFTWDAVASGLLNIFEKQLQNDCNA